LVVLAEMELPVQHSHHLLLEIHGPAVQEELVGTQMRVAEEERL
jgi:hypothetical protein